MILKIDVLEYWGLWKGRKFYPINDKYLMVLEISITWLVMEKVF